MYCRHIPIRKKAVSLVRDANDLFLLSFAETIPADFIITGDKDLLSLGFHRQTKIVTYREFETIIELL
jgi:predicted nucleic acid-binding protein